VFHSIENAPPPPLPLPPGRLNSFPLRIELIPKQLYYQNLRNAMPRRKWRGIADGVKESAGYRCTICGAEPPLECHEDWLFDEGAHVLRLRGFLALCKLCHHVKHIGLARTFARQGVLDFEAIIKHFQAVNQCTRYEFKEHESAEIQKSLQRNRHDWKMDLGEFAGMLTASD
jgi:hypothetical protein